MSGPRRAPLPATHARLIRPAIALALTLTSAGCGSGSGPPPAPAGPYELGASAAPPGRSFEQGRAASPGTAAPVAAAATPASGSSGIVIPRDARYTIVCTSFGSGNHVQVAKASKENLIKATGRADFYVVHDESESTLYFGYYREVEHQVDPNEADRAEKDLVFIRQLVDGQGRKLFPGSLKIAIPTPDPEAPAQFDLARLNQDRAPDDPARKFWSIAVAAYTTDGHPVGEDRGKSRKQLAVESVLAARKQGVEAYYYNGPTTSLVCVGAWPRSAVREQEASRAGSDRESDTNQDILVSPIPLPKNFTDKLQNSGRDIKVFQPKIEFNDQSLLSTWRQYPEYSVNGVVQITSVTDPETGKSDRKHQQTFLVEIPRQQPKSLLGGQTAEETSTPAVGGPVGIFNPLTPGSGGGRLRSVTP